MSVPTDTILHLLSQVTYTSLKNYTTGVSGFPTSCSNALQRRVRDWRASHNLPATHLNIFNAEPVFDYDCEDCIFTGRLANLGQRYGGMAIQVSHLYFFQEENRWFNLYMEGEEDIPNCILIPDEYTPLVQESFLSITGKMDSILSKFLGTTEKTVKSWYTGPSVIPAEVIRELASVYLTNGQPSGVVRQLLNPNTRTQKHV